MNTGQTYVEERKFFLPSQESEDAIFRKKYDDVQMQLQTLAGMNDLLSGTVGPRVGILHRISSSGTEHKINNEVTAGL